MLVEYFTYFFIFFFKKKDFSSNPEELKQFWVDHHIEVYNLLLVKFTEFDDASKRGTFTLSIY